MAEDETDTCRAVVMTTTTTATTAVNVNGSGGGGMGGDMVVGNSNRFGRQWQHSSSRILRVSRASGGKDRHSKVLTAKGPRDRRVRLSVTTAIQFYDLQDRLGYDQPSKAVEWLIKAASGAINDLPSLNTSSFPPEAQPQLSDEPRVNTNVVDSDPNLGTNQQQMGSKSGCSSNNSETSKGSGGLSLSQKEIRNKARERARERIRKEKERDSVGDSSRVNLSSQQHLNQHQQQNVSSMPQTSSFTQLLTGRMTSLNDNNGGGGGGSSSPSPHHGRGNNDNSNGNGNGNGNGNSNQWLSSALTTTSMADYFGTGLISLSSSRVGQIQQPPQVMSLASFGGSENEQHFPFLSDHQHHNHNHNHHLIQVSNTAATGVSGGGNDYNLNFTMSSSSTMTPSFNNRGTLQSNNSPSLVMPYLQRFSPDGSSLPFFLGSAATVSSTSPTVDNHHHHHHHQQFQPPGLQLCYGDNGARQTDHKGKGKNN